MKRFKIAIAIIILIASLVLLFDKLFTPQPIQIVLTSGQEITTQDSEYFTSVEAIFLIACSFFIGATAMYLYHNSDNLMFKPAHPEHEKHKIIIPLLKEDEKRVYETLKSSGGEVLQNKLVIQLNLPKVKITRLLASMERKRLILKERRGLTNSIRLI
jgi:uncharacterized membrane protein